MPRGNNMIDEDKFYKMVEQDIERLSASKDLPKEEKLKMHREIDGRYQACIKDWYAGLWFTNPQLTNIYYARLSDYDSEYIQENLDMMKSKLESFRFKVNAEVHPQPLSQQINVTTNANFNLNITFEQARLQVKDMDSLTDAQTKDVLNRITEIEKIVQSTDSKKSKWEKVKPALVWLADKSYDLAKTILPLILKIQE